MPPRARSRSRGDSVTSFDAQNDQNFYPAPPRTPRSRAVRETPAAPTPAPVPPPQSLTPSMARSLTSSSAGSTIRGALTTANVNRLSPANITHSSSDVYRESMFGEKWSAYCDRESARTGQEVPTPPVYVKMKIHSIGNFTPTDGQKWSCEIEMTLMLDWEDQSIVGVDRPLIDADHFSPYVTIDNCGEDDGIPTLTGIYKGSRVQEVEKKPDGSTIFPRPGHSKRTMKYKTKLSLSRWDLDNYPFDSHAVHIYLRGTGGVRVTSASLLDDEHASPRALFEKEKSEDHATERKCFHTHDFSKKASEKERQDWKILKFEKDEIRMKDNDTMLVVTVIIQRNPTRVLVQVFGLFICIALSISAFFLDPRQELGERLACTSANLLALGSFYQNNRDLSQAYLTLLDWYIIYLIFLCFGQGWAHVLISVIPDTREELLSALQCPNATSAAFALVPPVVPTPEPPQCAAGEESSCEASPYDIDSIAITAFAALSLMAVANFLWNEMRHIKNDKKSEFIKMFFHPIFDVFQFLLKIFVKAVVCVFVISFFGMRWTVMRSGLALWQTFLAISSCFLGFFNSGGQCSGLSNVHLCNRDVVAIVELFTSNTFLFYLSVFFIVYAHFTLWASVAVRYFEPNFFEHKKVPPKSMWSRTMSMFSLAFSRAVEAPVSVKQD